MRLWQGIDSSKVTTTQRFIVHRYIETCGSYIVYLQKLSLATVLYLKGHKKRRA